MLTVETQVHFEMGKRTRKRIQVGPAPLHTEPEQDVPDGSIPKVTRLMALAIRMQQLLREGIARNYADLARLGGVTRARLTQIMNLLLLAPDIQEELLYLPRTTEGRHKITEQDLRPIAAIADWQKQRKAWEATRQNAE